MYKHTNQKNKNMIKRFFLLAVIGLFTQLAIAQSPIGDGGIQLNGGLGLNNADGVPVYVGADFGVAPLITVGGQAGFSDNFFTLGANANYHFDELLELPSEWNVYGGATLAFVDATGLDDDGDIDLGLQLGGRYYFNDNLGLNLEAGGGTQLSGGKIGLSYVLQ